MSGERILVVDDEPDVVRVCTKTLLGEGYQIRGANGGQEALTYLAEEPFDLLLVDLMMPDVDGLTVLRRAKELDPGITAVIITAYGTLRNAVDALRAGARGFLLKPFDLADLLLAVDEALVERRREQENLRMQALLPILEISQAMVAEGDVASLAERLLEAVLQQVVAERGALMLLDEEIGELHVAGDVGLPTEGVEETHFPLKGGVAEQSLLQEMPLLLEGEAELDPLWRALAMESGTVAVCVPLLARQKAIGVLGIGRPDGETPFAPSELNLLSVMGSQIATALDNVRLYGAVARRNRELAMLNRAGQALNSNLDLDRVLVTVLGEVRGLLDVVACSIWLLRPETGELVCRQASGPGREIVRGWCLPPGIGLAGWVASSGESLIVPDALADERYFNGVDEQTGVGLRSILSVPLRVRENVIGVLQVVDTEVGRFRSAELTLAESLAASAATAIENARLFELAWQEVVERERAEVSLRAERDKAQRYLDIAGVIVVIDAHQRVTLLNRKGCEVLGYEEEEIVGKDWFDTFIPERDRETIKAVFQKLMGGAVEPVEYYENSVLTKSGEERIIAWHNTALKDEAGDIIGTLSSGEDITERVLAEEALRESERRFRSLFENAPLCIFEVDVQQTPPAIVRANRQAEKTYGWSSEELATLSVNRLVPPESAPDLERMTNALRAGQAVNIESVSQRRDGTVFPVRVSATSENLSDPSRVVIAVEDITAEKSRRSEEEAIAEERRRIAREIHDGLAQDLASLRLRVRLWHDLVDDDPAQMHAELQALRELLGAKIHEVRRSIFALRPVALDELGFFPALRQFTNGFGEQNRLRIDLRILGPEDRLSSPLEPVLFRIVQEALNNVAKHAYARMAWVELDLQASDSVTLRVRDDGRGFDSAILSQTVQNGHLGLEQMRERVEILGGTLVLDGRPGGGTAIQVVLPLSQS
jgi:PAS domain S-box-containing protein